MSEWIEYKKGWEISEQIHNDKTYIQIQKLLKKGEQIADYSLLQELRNKKIDNRFKNFWVFVPNPDKISKNNNYFARFGADSDRADLGCDGSPSGRNSSLGVFLIRKKVKKKVCKLCKRELDE